MRRLALLALVALLAACDPVFTVDGTPTTLHFPDAADTGPTTTPTTGCPSIDAGDGNTHDDITGDTPTTADDGLHDCIFTGELYINNGTDVVVHNVAFTATTATTAAIYANYDAGIVTVDHVEISGNYTAEGFLAWGLAPSMVASEIHHLHVGADGVRAYTNATLSTSYIHDLGYINCGGCPLDDDPHEDGLQVEAPVALVTITHNTIIGGSNAAIQISPEDGGDGDGPIFIDYNLLMCQGCARTLRIYEDGANRIEDIETTEDYVFAGSGGYVDTNYSAWTRDHLEGCAVVGSPPSGVSCTAL